VDDAHLQILKASHCTVRMEQFDHEINVLKFLFDPRHLTPTSLIAIPLQLGIAVSAATGASCSLVGKRLAIFLIILPECSSSRLTISIPTTLPGLPLRQPLAPMTWELTLS